MAFIQPFVVRHSRRDLTQSICHFVGLALFGVLASATSAWGETLPTPPTDAALQILPKKVVLRGRAASQRMLVEWVHAGEDESHALGQVRDGVSISIGDPGILAWEDGRLLPRGNGSTTVTADFQGHTAQLEVRVEGVEQPWVPSFRNEVQSVLSKTGCNSGACHGALAGKNGFLLSLRGYDTEADFAAITRHARGRRVVPREPAKSLLLTKPTGAVPHKGGVRFDVDSPAFEVLAQWLAMGCPQPREEDPRIQRLEILPASLELSPGVKQDLIVMAHFSDGTARDVSRWAKYTSTNETVAKIDEQGGMSVMGYGKGAISAWYLSMNAVSTVRVPYEHVVDPEVFTAAPRENFIDEIVLDQLAKLNIPPSPPCTDGEFIRRAFVDTLGVLPSAKETREFISDGAPDKRERLIDGLFQRPEFVDYWAHKWSDLLLVNSAKLSLPAVWAYYDWIRDQVAANRPWDELTREIVTASGSTLENGAANFFVLHKNPQMLAENTSMAFLGMSIECARCHNHPLEKWTNDQYYGMANLFSRVRLKQAPGDGNAVVFPVGEGELIQPRTGHPQPPRPLDGSSIPFEADLDRREVLADWLTSSENPYFSRAITNRVWANFLGTGIVENVDDLRLTNPASNEQLLAELSRFLVDHDYDLRALMRLILQSATYQRSSQPLPENAADERNYSRYYPRRLQAEVLLDAISQVTEVPTKFAGYPAGWRSMQLPDANVESYFLTSFGRPQRNITCECERSDAPSMTQVLHLANGDVINQKLAEENNCLSRLLDAAASYEEILEELFLAALARKPTPRERAAILEQLSLVPMEETRDALEDVYWSVLSSKEFLMNH